MPIAFVGYEAVVNEDSVSSTVVPVPAGVVAGHVMLATIATTAIGEITLPAGWTRREAQLRDGQADFLLCYRVSTGGEPATYTWTFADIGASVGQIVAYSGVDNATPIAAAGNANTTVDTTTIDTAALTVPVGGLYVYLPTDRRNNAATVQSWSTGAAPDIRRGEISGSDGSGSVFSNAAFDNDVADSGLLSRTLTATQTWAQVQVWSVALNPHPVQDASPTGIAASTATGSPTLVPGVVLVGPTSIASGSAIGEPALVPAGFIHPEGLPSQAAVGQPMLNLAIQPTGIAGSASVGTPALARFLIAFTLFPPTVKQTPMAWNRLHARYSLIRGVSIIQRTDGTFYTTQFPAQTELEDSQRYWLGGYVHPLSSEEALDLIDAGFGEYVNRESTPA